jgi:hypothetical protein
MSSPKYTKCVCASYSMLLMTTISNLEYRTYVKLLEVWLEFSEQSDWKRIRETPYRRRMETKSDSTHTRCTASSHQYHSSKEGNGSLHFYLSLHVHLHLHLHLPTQLKESLYLPLTLFQTV